MPPMDMPPDLPQAADIVHYQHLVSSQTWQEIWPDELGNEQPRLVHGELWTVALQAVLDAHGVVFIPKRTEPYYLDAPLVLKSGDRLLASPHAEIRLKPDTNTCMVRNAHLVNGQNGPVRLGESPDTDIVIQGGIWSTLATSHTQTNGNVRGCANATDSFPGAHGTILLHNVQHATVRNVTINQCKPFGIQIGHCSDFMVENIRFENHRRDGVHVEGPAAHGVIRNLQGVTGDDMVALNSWDWKQYSLTFGPISDIQVENVTVTGTDLHEWALNLRLLGGTKHFPDGQTLDCNIESCTFRNIRGIRTFQLFDQPNLELGRDNDFADPIGMFHNLSFEEIHFLQSTPAPPFQIASNIDGISICNVHLHFASAPDFKLVQIGPQSRAYTFNSDDRSTWREIYSPDKDCTVKNMSLTNVYALTPVHREMSTSNLIQVVIQQLNPDYPRTTPRGGTGRGILITDDSSVNHPVAVQEFDDAEKSFKTQVKV